MMLLWFAILFQTLCFSYINYIQVFPKFPAVPLLTTWGRTVKWVPVLKWPPLQEKQTCWQTGLNSSLWIVHPSMCPWGQFKFYYSVTKYWAFFWCMISLASFFLHSFYPKVRTPLAQKQAKNKQQTPNILAAKMQASEKSESMSLWLHPSIICNPCFFSFSDKCIHGVCPICVHKARLNPVCLQEKRIDLTNRWSAYRAERAG